MSAPTSTVPTLSTDRRSRPSMATLTKIELRKSWDTRAGMWLLIAIAGLTALIIVVALITASSSDETWDNFFGIPSIVQAFLLPVLGILLVTSEWSQRTGLTTFTLVPLRARIIQAKASAAVLLALAAVVFAGIVGAVVNLLGIATGGSGDWNLTSGHFGGIALLQVVNIMQGVAFGMLFLNSAAAIVVFYLLPIAWSILTNVVTSLHGVRDWLDLGTTSNPLSNGDRMDVTQWAQLGTSVLVWVALPLAVGIWRLLRSEVK
ncbi:MAG: ABC transporter permease [Nocardioidaceae bacterium]